MRIAIYKDNLSTGRGADRAVRNFADGILARGHDVLLMEKVEFAVKVLNAAAGAGNFDVIVATGSNEIVDLSMAGYFNRSHRAKVVLQLHLAPRGFFKWRHPLRNRRIRKAFNMADAVQVLCRSYETEFKAIAPRPPVTVIGNYTDMQALDASRAARQSEVVSPVILYPAAALNRIKNQKLLIEAFAMVAGDFPEWRVRLLGKDTTPYSAACRALVKRKGLSSRIEIAGFTDNLVGEYSRAAFVAFPSTLEGFPLAVLEAARFRLPVVAQQGLPGIEDIVTEETGLVTASDALSYAEGLRRLMGDDALRRRLGEAACRRCDECYARSKILDQWETLLEGIID